MKKVVLILTAAIMITSMAACGAKPAEPVSASKAANNSDEKSASKAVSNSDGNPHSSQGGNGTKRQPNANQQVDAYYSIDDLIELVKEAGCISGQPENIELPGQGIIKGVSYGNVVFLEYESTDVKSFEEAYAADKVKVDGKEAKIGAINGPYVMAFIDGNVDENAVKAFHSLGFGN